MDPSILLILSNLLHFQNTHHHHHHHHPHPPHTHYSQLDPTATTTFLLPNSHTPPSTISPPTPTPLLLLVALASLISLSSSTTPPRNLPNPSPSSSSSTSSQSPFRSLTSLRHLPPSERDPPWRSACGLSYPVFASLAEQLVPHLRRSASVPALFQPELALFVALSRLARGASARAIARSHRLAPSLVSRLTNAVTRMLSTHLYRDYVEVPSGHRLLETAHHFKDICSLANICGAIDASPVKLKHPPASNESDAYLCHHGFPAVLLQVVADHRKVFWDVCIKAPGSVDDASHFRDSHLYTRFTKGEILHDALVTVQGHLVRPFIVGDWAFPLLSFLMTPYTPNGSGDHVQNAFDAALMRARAASVEAAIRLLKGRWRILRELNVGIDHAAQTVVACCVLHNMCQHAGEPEDDRAYEWKEPRESAPPAATLQEEYQSLCMGETLRDAMSKDLCDRLQRLSAGGRGK